MSCSVTPQPHFRSEDHDILIEVKTLTNVLLREVGDLKTRTNDQLSQKADKTEVQDLARRMQESQDRERDQITALSDKMDENQRENRTMLDDNRKENKKLIIWVSIGYGALLGAQALLPYILHK